MIDGCGIYKQRSGEEIRIIGNDGHMEFPWVSSIDGRYYRDDGLIHNGSQSPMDIVSKAKPNE